MTHESVQGHLRKLARDFAISVSLANLLFMRVWAELFEIGKVDAYYLKLGSREFLAVTLDMILLGALFTAAASARRWGGTAGRRIVDLGFVMVMLVLLSNLGPLKSPGVLVLLPLWRDGQFINLVVVALMAMAIVAAIVRWRQRVRVVVMSVLLAFSPFALLTTARSAWYVATIHPDVALADRTAPLGSGEDAPDGPRVVVLLFDAMGRRLSVEARPEGVSMPALDRLRAESLDAANVTQAGQSTKYAVPGLLTGRRLAGSKPAGIDELRLTFPDGHSEMWSGLDNLFGQARKLGGRSSVVGWYHPYCRMLEEDLSDCSWYPSSTSGGRAREAGLAGAMVDAATATFPYTVYRRRQLLTYHSIRTDGERAITRHGAGFTFVHVPIPHKPYIYDRHTGQFTILNFRITNGYVDALVLADRTLAELRVAMERAGTWDTSTVLVTSDHSALLATKAFGMKDTEVPVILKFPGQTEGVEYEKPFHATELHGLLLGALRGEIRTAADATSWLDANTKSEPAASTATSTPGSEEL